MSRILNQRQALAKLRVELEDREEKLYRRCKKFGHLTHNVRTHETIPDFSQRV